jgi:hypothetical protein
MGRLGLTALVSGGLSGPVAGRGRYAVDAAMRTGKGLLTCAVMAVSERCGALEVTRDTHPWPVARGVAVLRPVALLALFFACLVEWT